MLRGIFFWFLQSLMILANLFWDLIESHCHEGKYVFCSNGSCFCNHILLREDNLIIFSRCCHDLCALRWLIQCLAPEVDAFKSWNIPSWWWQEGNGSSEPELHLFQQMHWSANPGRTGLSQTVSAFVTSVGLFPPSCKGSNVVLRNAHGRRWFCLVFL